VFIYFLQNENHFRKIIFKLRKSCSNARGFFIFIVQRLNVYIQHGNKLNFSNEEGGQEKTLPTLLKSYARVQYINHL